MGIFESQMEQQLDVIGAYLKEHDLQGKVAEAVTKCVQALPEDPNKFLAAYFAEKAGVAAPEAAPAQKKESKKEKKEKAKKEKAAKAEPKVDPEAEAKKRAKQVKAIEKEGGKKGVEIEGASDMGGLAFFCTTLMEPDGVAEDLVLGFTAMNADPPEDPEEERRGGAWHVGKMVFSAGPEFLQIICNVPEDLQVDKQFDDRLRKATNASEWVQYVLDAFAKEAPGCKVNADSTASFAPAAIPANKEKGVFPLKIKDDAMSAAYRLLRERGCFNDDSSSDGPIAVNSDLDDY